MVVQTYFFRRTNMNALGQPRSWTDHLLWHHAATRWICSSIRRARPSSRRNALEGPHHPELKIAMDMSIQLKNAAGRSARCRCRSTTTGRSGTFFRYICDNGTYIARYDDLVTGREEPIDLSKVAVSMNGIELQDREFFAAIEEGSEPNARWRRCWGVIGCWISWRSN